MTQKFSLKVNEYHIEELHLSYLKNLMLQTHLPNSKMEVPLFYKLLYFFDLQQYNWVQKNQTEIY